MRVMYAVMSVSLYNRLERPVHNKILFKIISLKKFKPPKFVHEKKEGNHHVTTNNLKIQEDLKSTTLYPIQFV